LKNKNWRRQNDAPLCLDESQCLRNFGCRALDAMSLIQDHQVSLGVFEKEERQVDK
jgi:hypothetical protein